MTLLDIVARCSSNQTEDRVFVIEAIGLRSLIGPANPKTPIRQSCRMKFRVPYARLSQEIRRIALQGGKIVSILPLSAGGGGDVSSQTEDDWWVEVSTQQPKNQFYFGPFGTSSEAESQLPGYVEDLSEEGAEEITYKLLQGHPEQLTIAHAA